jgi:hypothetical protein
MASYREMDAVGRDRGRCGLTAKQCLLFPDLTEWERDFLESLVARPPERLSTRQAEVLFEIHDDNGLIAMTERRSPKRRWCICRCNFPEITRRRMLHRAGILSPPTGRCRRCVRTMLVFVIERQKSTRFGHAPAAMPA